MVFTICRIAYDYPRGSPTYGLQPVFYYLSKEQAKRGNQVHVFAGEVPGEPATKNDNGVQVHRLPKPFSLNVMRHVRSLARSDPNVVLHTHATNGLLVAAVKKSLSSPIITHVHGTTRSPHTPSNFLVGEMKVGYSVLGTTYSFTRERFCWTLAEGLLAVSDEVKESLVNYYGISASKIDVVHNGVDVDLFSPKSSQRVPEEFRPFEGLNVVLYVGHFGARKGLGHLLLAMKDVIKSVSDAVLICVGGFPSWQTDNSYELYLRGLVRQYDLENRAFFFDKIPNEQLPSVYSLSKVVVLPSYYESLGKVLIEAMACGKPTIATSGGGADEVISDRKSGFLVNYGSPRQLAEAIIRVLEDRRLAETMGSEGRNIAEKSFTWQEAARKIDDVYGKALQKALYRP